MNPKSVVMIASSLFLLGGCGSFGNRTGADKLVYSQDDKETAVAILSAGAAEMCVSFATRLKLLQAESPYSGPNVAFLPVDSYVVKSEYADHHGYLHVLRLKPGSYYFAPYINNSWVRLRRVPRMDFNVSAGEVVYLGEFYLRESCGPSGGAELRDQWDRDRALLRAKNPALSQASIQRRILRYTGEIKF